jgi:hypothetical protein
VVLVVELQRKGENLHRHAVSKPDVARAGGGGNINPG